MHTKEIGLGRGFWILSFLVFLLGGGLAGSLLNDSFDFRRFEPLYALMHPSSNKKEIPTVIQQNGKMYVSVESLKEDFKVELGKGNEFAIFGGKTWIPVNGAPIETIVLSDKTCGEKCDTTQSVNVLRQQVTPALLVREVDVTSAEGKDLVKQFDVNSVPKYILADGIKNHKLPSGDSFVEKSAPFLIEKDGKYMIESEKVGFPVGMFLKSPAFADLATEPRKGKGKVRVVEFTDYQCSYCKRLFNQNKDIVKQLVDEGKIEYIMKDFPLNFHAEAVGAHIAANCAQKIGGNDAYWQMHDKLFDTQSEWSGKGDTGSKAHFKTLASEIVLDAKQFEDCMGDEAMKKEVDADQEEGQKYGVSGTPALFIGRQIMPGAIGPKAFEEAVKGQ